jgi:DNA-binding response OmpR family regulator
LQEFRILRLLMEEPGRVVSRQEIIDRLWGADKGPMSNSLSVIVSRLRRKLIRPDGSSRIRTVRTVGYAFDVPIKAASEASMVAVVS